MKKDMSGSISIYVEGCEMICPICKEKVESGKGHAHDFSYTSGGKSEEAHDAIVKCLVEFLKLQSPQIK